MIYLIPKLDTAGIISFHTRSLEKAIDAQYKNVNDLIGKKDEEQAE